MKNMNTRFISYLIFYFNPFNYFSGNLHEFRTRMKMNALRISKPPQFEGIFYRCLRRQPLQYLEMNDCAQDDEIL